MKKFKSLKCLKNNIAKLAMSGIFTVFICWSHFGFGQIKGLPKKIKELVPAVVRLDGSGTNGMTGGGTGFFIDPSGIIATNYHVVDNMKSITVLTSDLKLYKPDSVLLLNKAFDLAVFSIHNPKGRQFATVKFSDKKVIAGEPVFVIGSPASNYNWVTHTGIVSGVYNDKPYVEMIQTSVPVSPGNSGSPLFNRKGKVIGIIKLRGGPGAESISMAIPVKFLLNLENDTSTMPFAFLPEAEISNKLDEALRTARFYRQERQNQEALDVLLPFVKEAGRLSRRRQIDLYNDIASNYNAQEDYIKAYIYFGLLYERIRPYMLEAYEDSASWQRVFGKDPKLHQTVFTSMMNTGMCQIQLGMNNAADSILAVAISQAYTGLKMLPKRKHVYELFIPELHYSRAVCKLAEGKLEEGCLELREAEKRGKASAKELIDEYCK